MELWSDESTLLRVDIQLGRGRKEGLGCEGPEGKGVKGSIEYQ